ncbi:hypothetical protein WDZ92_29370 [Nostoc sp. NIES-2111]
MLAESGGALDRALAEDCMNPGFTRDGDRVAEPSSAFAQTLNAAVSIGVVIQERGRLERDAGCTAKTYAEFCDWAHTRLVGLDSSAKDAVLLETYAWLVAEGVRQGSVGWVQQWTPDAFADAADKALPEGDDDDGQRRMNRTKLPAWRRWLIALGLYVPMPTPAQPHPSPESRLSRELRELGSEEAGNWPADMFVMHLARRMPYLDGGRMYTNAAKRMGLAAGERRLSPLLSAALRGLHDEGSLTLHFLGDAAGFLQLWPDRTHRLQAFHAVQLNAGASA